MTHVKTLSILLTFFFSSSHIWTWNVCATFFHLAYLWMLVFYNPPFSFSFMFWLDFRERTRLKKQCYNIFKTKKMNSFQLLIHYSPRMFQRSWLFYTTLRLWTTDLKLKPNIDHGLILLLLHYASVVWKLIIPSLV